MAKFKYLTIYRTIRTIEAANAEEACAMLARTSGHYTSRAAEEHINSPAVLADASRFDAYRSKFIDGVPHIVDSTRYGRQEFTGSFFRVPKSLTSKDFVEEWFKGVPDYLRPFMRGFGYLDLRELVNKAQTEGWRFALDDFYNHTRRYLQELPLVAEHRLAAYPQCWHSCDQAVAAFTFEGAEVTCSRIGDRIILSNGQEYTGSLSTLRGYLRKLSMPADTAQTASTYQIIHGHVQPRLSAYVQDLWLLSEGKEVNSWLKTLKVDAIRKIRAMEFTSWNSIRIRLRFNKTEQELRQALGGHAWRALLKMPLWCLAKRLTQATSLGKLKRLALMRDSSVSAWATLGWEWAVWLENNSISKDIVTKIGVYDVHSFSAVANTLYTTLGDTLNMARKEGEYVTPAGLTRRGLLNLHDKLTVRIAERNYSKTPIYQPETLEVDGVVFKRLTSPFEYWQEGREMHHCVASYSDRGNSRIYAVSSAHGRSTLEMRGREPVQHQGKYNKNLPAEHVAALEKLIGTINRKDDHVKE